MNRARLSFAGTLTVAVWCAGVLAAGQTPQAPPMKSVLAGRSIAPPARGEVPIEYTSPVSRQAKGLIITTIRVKNVGKAPIARLTLNESWFSASGANLSNGRAAIDGVLQPGEVKTLTIETPFKAGMARSSMKFSHQNGTIKEKQVAKLTDTSKK